MVDGAAGDACGLRALGFPAFARGVTPRNYQYVSFGAAEQLKEQGYMFSG